MAVTLGLYGAVLVFFLLIWVVRSVYDVFFGPLSKYPGPKLNAATRLVLARHLLRGTEVQYVHRLHLRYGPVVRISPTDLSYCDGRAWKDIYGTYNSVVNGVKTGQLLKDPKFYLFSVPNFDDILMANDVNHARMRRNFSNAFSDKALKRQESTIRKYTMQFISLLDKAAASTDNEVDFTNKMSYVTFDIMADLSFGEPLGCLDRNESHPWVDKTFDLFRVVPMLIEVARFPWLAKMIEMTTPKEVIQDRMIHYNYAIEFTDRKIARKDDKPDIWGIALHAKDEYKLSSAEIYGNARLFMTAGTETTASLLCGLTYYLVTNADKLALLEHEMKYLNACLEEGLRLFPPFPSFVPRVAPEGGAVICGQFVPGGTTIFIHQYSTYHNPANFKHPDEFKPERWLDDPEYEDDKRFALQPFSTGPRNCLGKNLAYLEMRMVVANLVWHFDLTLSPSVENWLDQTIFIGWQRKPLPIVIKKAAHVSAQPVSVDRVKTQ